MSASSPGSFYFAQIVGVLIAVVPIGLILVATFVPHQTSRRLLWLRIVTAVWLLVTLLSRSALSSSVSHFFMSGTFASAEVFARQTHLYFLATSVFWAAEQVMFLIFSIALFFVLRRALASSES